MIKGRLPARLAETLMVKAFVLHRKFDKSREKDFLVDLEACLSDLKKYQRKWYQGYLLEAMCAFVLRRDISQALTVIRKCKHVTQDATWRFSEAFLLAYQGDLQAAYRIYSRAFGELLMDKSVSWQVEQFIQEVLNEEPEKRHLYFCLGFINFRWKQDLTAARNDFQRFIESPAAGKCQSQVRAVEKWIKEIDDELDKKVHAQ